MPEPLVFAMAHFLTAVAGVTQRPPLIDMPLDRMRVMNPGFQVEEGKAARELGPAFTPVCAGPGNLVPDFLYHLPYDHDRTGRASPIRRDAPQRRQERRTSWDSSARSSRSSA
jgi:hypothetical protein